MYNNIVNFKIIGHVVNADKDLMLEMFFKDWVDNTSINYNIDIDNWHSLGKFKVKFENEEDALALKLKGIPFEFQSHIEIVSTDP